MSIPDLDSDYFMNTIRGLVQACSGEDSNDFAEELVAQMIRNSLRLLIEGHDMGQLKLITRSLKEMRYAFRIFNEYPNIRRISIFGSARTPEDHPDYSMAKNFSNAIADLGWMCITGGANGIMKAGIEGQKEGASFGLSISLPNEITTNSLIEGDRKLIIFRYFFTRKLMFMSHSDALAAFPGGVGTMDELFEALTLMQTGKARLIPLVLLEGEGGTFWDHWEKFLEHELIDRGWCSPIDKHLWHRAKNPQDAVAYIENFYRIYHSSRYVKDDLVIRLNKPLSEKKLSEINTEFASLLAEGKFWQGKAFEDEKDCMELPRLIFKHTRKDFGKLMALLHFINEM